MVVFPQPVGPTSANSLSRLHLQIKILNQRMLLMIRKRNVVNLHPAFCTGRMCSIRVIRCFCRLIHHRKHPLCAGKSSLKLSDNPRNLVKWLGVLVCVGQKAGQCTDGKSAANAGERSHQSNRRVHHAIDKSRAGIGQRGIKLCLDTCIVQLVVDAVKFLLCALFIAKTP